MGCSVILVVLFLAFPISLASTLDQCFGQQSTGSGSGMADHQQQVTKLKYCLIDDTTIMKTDTGEQLDIVYTTDSKLIVTAVGCQTSLVITKNKPEVTCTTEEDQTVGIIALILGSKVLFSTGYILIIHLMFKELQKILGKLLIIYSIAVIVAYISNIFLVLTRFKIVPSSPLICRILTHFAIQGFMIREASSTCILTYVIHLMHRSYHLRTGVPKYIFRYCMSYILGTLTLFNIITISYDLATGNGARLFSPNGYCEFASSNVYSVVEIVDGFNNLNKAFQVGMFVAYLFYFYKFYKQRVVADKQLHQELTRIAVTLGASVGISQVVWVVANIAGYLSFAIIFGLLSFVVQQFVIMAVFVCNKKIVELCRKKIGKE